MKKGKRRQMSEKECGLISRYEADKTIMHLNFANRRMLIALISVCVTAIILSIGTILIFVHSYTEREQNWQKTFRELVNGKTTVTEVYDGQKTN